MSAQGTCPECGMTGYLTGAGLVRKHQDKRGGKRRYEREQCPGGGSQPVVDELLASNDGVSAAAVTENVRFIVGES